jgi:LmbE family N-acetylglucosaminyl deacetylase
VLRRLIRWGYRRLLHPSARNSLHLALLLAEHDRAPEPITEFAASCVLVLAPHMDDEVIGCGGVVARHVAAGARVAVAYMTDGRGSASFPPGVTDAEIAAGRVEVRATRRREAHAAAAILGILDLYFLDAVDGSLRPDGVVVGALARRVTELRPEIIYLPFAMDMHGDHWQTNLVFAACVDRLPPGLLQHAVCRGYEVGTPAVANRVANITAVMDVKRAALRAYPSQLAHTDYVRCVEGLNAYRSLTFGRGHGYAEAFHESSVAAYRELLRRAAAQR